MPKRQFINDLDPDKWAVMDLETGDLLHVTDVVLVPKPGGPVLDAILKDKTPHTARRYGYQRGLPLYAPQKDDYVRAAGA